ncbi:MAG: hypothetical protein WD379_00910 [Dehalococcoidia bacterium]
MTTQVKMESRTQTRVDFGAAVDDAMVGIGERFGLYEVMATMGPVTVAEVAQRAGISERDARFWLSAQAAGDYIHLDEARGRYSVSCAWPRSN